MSRSLFKKVIRTKITGKCAGFGGATWTERLKSVRYANKAIRRLTKI